MLNNLGALWGCSLSSVAEIYRTTADEYIEELVAWTEEDQPFACMARAFLELVRKEVAEMEGP